jgi:hypothetical protein
MTDLIQSIALVVLSGVVALIAIGAKRKIERLEDQQERLEEELRLLRKALLEQK